MTGLKSLTTAAVVFVQFGNTADTEQDRPHRIYKRRRHIALFAEKKQRGGNDYQHRNDAVMATVAAGNDLSAAGFALFMIVMHIK